MSFSITDCTFKLKDPNHVVTFTFNNELKSAKCLCGSEWIPESVNDTICKRNILHIIKST